MTKREMRVEAMREYDREHRELRDVFNAAMDKLQDEYTKDVLAAQAARRSKMDYIDSLHDDE